MESESVWISGCNASWTTWKNSAGICSIPGDLHFANFPGAILNLAQFNSGTSGSALCISTSLTLFTFYI